MSLNNTRSGAGMSATKQPQSASTSEDEDEDETRFLLNLTRMCHTTEAVLMEHFIQVIAYLSERNIHELVFLESAYTAVLFNRSEFSFPASFEFYVKHYESAKQVDNFSFLRNATAAYRRARLILDEPGVKDKLRAFIEDRRRASQRQFLCKCVGEMTQYLEHYPACPGSAILQRTVTEVVNHPQLQQLLGSTSPN